jgi:integrase
MSRSKTDRAGTVLARYTDPHGRPHRVVLRGRLVLDLAVGDVPRVVARLSGEEGESQAHAMLEASAIDAGYLARARREPRPFIRALTADDLRPLAEAQDEAEADGQAPDGAADEPPLAA